MGITRLLARAAPLLCALCTLSCGRQPVAVEPGVSLDLAGRRAKIVADLDYSLHLTLPADPEAAIPGTVRLRFRLLDAGQPLQLDFRAGADQLRRVAVNGEPSAYLFEAEHIVIPRSELRAGDNSVEIEFLAGSAALNRNPDYLYTLFVPDRARTVFPLFDQPDLKATWTLALDLPAGWTALSNAPAASETRRADGATLVFERTQRISSYLFAFVAGRFETLTREIGGRKMTMLHRETDAARVARNVDAIFRLHAAALDWLEAYTGIPYPFGQFAFAAIPAFQFGGMEHPGAIDYRADRLLLEEAPSDQDLLGRAALIAHETAHMWFGDLVTMRWFDDVWTKEVFANFMAAKIVNPGFPGIDHDLAFLVSHYPGAYSVDRTAGANPIRQPLANLDQAGQLYGDIIYDKAPIMMRQLEALIGPQALRDGLRDYLADNAFGNASWPQLVALLDRRSPVDLAAWSEVWVNTPGRPQFALEAGAAGARLTQSDPDGRGRVWPQRFAVLWQAPGGIEQNSVVSEAASIPLAPDANGPATPLVYNADGMGYGLFPADLEALDAWERLGDVARAELLVDLEEQMLASGRPTPAALLERLARIAASERNQLLLQLALGQLRTLYWDLLPAPAREAWAPRLEASLWSAMLAQAQESRRKIYFEAYADIALTPAATGRLLDVWSGELAVDALPLSESDRIDLAQMLAIKLPAESGRIVERQLAATQNPDERRRLEFVAPSLSAQPAVRDAFFDSLADERNRQTEPWVIEALANLHHPLRGAQSERYILPALELLGEIQRTGDIFFPSRWLEATLGGHHSAAAVRTVTEFLAARPDYNPQLRMKILQAADPMLRANRLVEGESPPQ